MTLPRVATFLALAMAVAGSCSPAGALPYEATLRFGLTGFASVSFPTFHGAGSGTSSGGGVTLPGSTFSGVDRHWDAGWYGPALLVARLDGNGPGSFLGDPLAGKLALDGWVEVRVYPDYVPVIQVPLLLTHKTGSLATSVGLGVGGIDRRTFRSPRYYIEIEHTIWTAGMKTLTGLVGLSPASTAMFTGSDSRTPGGLGQVTLVAPTKVTTNTLFGAFQPATVYSVAGSLTLRFVPEPGTLLLLGAGVAVLAARGRRIARPR